MSALQLVHVGPLCTARVRPSSSLIHHVCITRWLSSVLPVQRSLHASHVLHCFCFIVSIREFVESVDWEGKDASWDTLVWDTLAANDIKSLHRIGRLRVDVEKLQWVEVLSAGKRGFVEVCLGFSLRARVVR